jgi:CheY-like chemotaxis protein
LAADPELFRIPVVILTTSREERDVLRANELDVAAYITKPVDFGQLMTLVEEIDAFRLSIVTPVYA